SILSHTAAAYSAPPSSPTRRSSDLPFQARDGGGFITELAADGSTLLFSSLAESATQVALDPTGNAFVVGYSYGNPAKSSPSALLDRKSTRLNSSHRTTSYAVFRLKK